jgi:hypothetical protein
MSTPRPTYDPDELSKHDLTEEEAEDLRQGLEEADRGEGIPLAQVRAELLTELEAIARVRRTG